MTNPAQDLRTTPGFTTAADTDRPLPLPGRIIIVLVAGGAVVVGAPSGVGLLWAVPYGAVATILIVRRPRHAIGWILLALGWMFPLASSTLDATPAQFSSGSVPALMSVAGWLSASAGSVGFVLYATLMFTFPSGRLPGGRWRFTAPALLAIAAGTILVEALAPRISVGFQGDPTSVFVANPFAIGSDAAIWNEIPYELGFIVLVAVMAIAALSLAIRFRRTSGIERQQLRWVAAALGFVVLAVLSGLALGGIFPELSATGFIWIPAMLAFASVPIAVGVAVMRYRLYEIDRIISRTLGWTATTVVVAAAFGGLIVGLQAALAPYTSESTLAVALSTLVAAALFGPVHRRIQAGVDRRFNRTRVDAQRALDAFGSGLRDVTALDAVHDRLEATIRDTVQPRIVSVWTRAGGTGK
jgi:hypothetical protein